MQGKQCGGIEAVATALRGQGVDVVVERFRVPAWPQLSASAGFGLCAAGAFLLAAGRPAAAFLVGVSGSLLLLLDACGFSPLDWLGPKVRRSVAVIPGDPSERDRKALFLAVPLHCRLNASGRFSRKAALRHASYFLGLLLSLALATLAGGATLLYLPPLPGAGVVGGAALAVLAAGEWARGDSSPGPRNLAAGWVDQWLLPAGAAPRPFILLYSGDEAEVKFFLAKYRRPVLRGSGVFIEFPRSAGGAPAVTVREGPFIPYRVDIGLFSRVRTAGKACGIPYARMCTLRFKSAGLIAMARGFRAITLFRPEARAAEDPLSDEEAAAWIGRIALGGERESNRQTAGGPNGRPSDLTASRNGV
ncbi:MAG: hypothetical protein HZA60_02600 [Deltaproteobacteria bacterium]|nr:hypothetical protein [Deltaproteobacteria bacterium]